MHIQPGFVISGETQWMFHFSIWRVQLPLAFGFPIRADTGTIQSSNGLVQVWNRICVE